MDAIKKLEPNASLKDVIAAVNSLVESTPKKRDRGPESTREMTDADAARVKFGDLKDVKFKEAAKILGLSYGQVYSARLGFTFKKVKEPVTA